MTSVTSFPDALAAAARDVSAELEQALTPDKPPSPLLWEAMRYAVLGGGKRLRPFLVLASAEICGAPRAGALRTAAAIELMHAYSLIHDDLPAMDDDDLRHGQPTLHKQYDEATAILAGDALQSLAFDRLADPATHADAGIRGALVSGLARAAGAGGMAAGQMLDLAAEAAPAPLGEPDILTLSGLKTGALFAFSCESGAILADAPEGARAVLARFGADFGLAFQITDDLLDATGDAAAMGKAVGKDAGQGKATLVGLYGVDGARREAARICKNAMESLDFFGQKAELLRTATAYLIDRRA